MWNEVREGTLIGWMHQLRPVQALLPFALLLEEMIATVAVEGELAAAGHPDTLSRAAVGLELGHVTVQDRTRMVGCKDEKQEWLVISD